MICISKPPQAFTCLLFALTIVFVDCIVLSSTTATASPPATTTTKEPQNLDEIKKKIHQHVDRNHGENVIALNKPTLAPQMTDFAQDSMEVKVADATNQFGLNFLTNLINDPKENVVISPLSLQNLMNMILLGSNDRSATQEELNKVLGYNGDAVLQQDRLKPHEAMHSVFQSIQSATHFKQEQQQQQADLLNTNTGAVAAQLQTNHLDGETPLSQQINFTLANLVVTNEDKVKLSEEYGKELKQYYNVEMETFSKERKSQEKPLYERVNSWVKSMTQGQIDKLVSESDLDRDDLIMVLLNAAHFKGRWLHTFNPQATYESQFFNNGQEKEATTVKFMRQKGVFGFADFGTVSLQNEMSSKNSDDPETLLMDGSDRGKSNASAPTIELSKEEQKRLELANKLNCTVLMLPFSINDGQELSMVLLLPAKKDGLADLQAALSIQTLNEIYKSLSEQHVRVELPRFSFESTHDARAVMSKMGLSSVFSNSASLDRMFSTNTGAKVDKIIHKAKIMVDETGAEAAAATMAQVVLRNFVRPPTPEFIANHPFLFIIRHNRSNMPLFMGRVSSLS